MNIKSLLKTQDNRITFVSKHLLVKGCSSKDRQISITYEGSLKYNTLKLDHISHVYSG